MKKTVYKIVADEGPIEGSSFVLSGNKHTIGRGENSNICIIDTAISKNHCNIEKVNDSYYLIDMSSRNGTFLNDIRLLPERKYELQPESEIRVGNSLLRFVPEGRGADDKQLMREATKELPPSDPAQTAREEIHPFYISSSKNLSAISRILDNLVGVTQRTDMIQKAIDSVFASTQSEHGYIFLTEDIEGGDPAPSVKRNRKADEEFSSGAVNEPLIRKAAAEGSTLLSTETSLDTRISPQKGQAASHKRSIICSPIKTGNRTLGIIYLDTTSRAEGFNKEDMELLSAAGMLIGSRMDSLQMYVDQRDLYVSIFKTLVNIVEAKDPFSIGHSQRVAKTSVAIAGLLDLGAEDIHLLYISALLHDIGKAAVPPEILTKPDKLSPEELAVVKKHPSAGASLVNHIADFNRVIDGILAHHERLNGKGYPNGLAGEEIPLFAKIIAVADTYDAMTSDRAFRKSFSERETIYEINKNQGKLFDGRVVKAFLTAYKNRKIVQHKERVISLSAFKT